MATEKSVWTGEQDGTIRIRSLPVGTELAVIERKDKSFCNALLLVEGKMWVGLSDGFIRVYDVSSSPSNIQLEKEFVHHSGSVYALHYSSGRVYSGGADWKLYQWNTSTMEYQRLFFGHSNSVRCITSYVGRSGPIIFSGSDDGTIKAWDPHAPLQNTKDVACIFTFKGHARAVLCMDIVPLRHQLWTGSEDHTIRVWDANACQCVAVLDKHRAPVSSLALVDTRVWTGAKDGSLMMWDAKTCAYIATLPDTASRPATGSAQRYILSVRRLYRGHYHKVWCAASDGVVTCWSSDGNTTVDDGFELLTREEEGLAKRREQSIQKLQRELYDHVALVNSREDQIKALEARIASLTDPFHKEEIAALRGQVAKSTDEQEELLKQKTALARRLAMAEDLLQATRKKLRDHEASSTEGTNSQAQTEELLAAAQRLAEENDYLKQQLQETLAENSELAQSSDRCEEAMQYARETTNRNAELQQHMRQLEAALASERAANAKRALGAKVAQPARQVPPAAGNSQKTSASARPGTGTPRGSPSSSRRTEPSKAVRNLDPDFESSESDAGETAPVAAVPRLRLGVVEDTALLLPQSTDDESGVICGPAEGASQQHLVKENKLLQGTIDSLRVENDALAESQTVLLDEKNATIAALHDEVIRQRERIADLEELVEASALKQQQQRGGESTPRRLAATAAANEDAQQLRNKIGELNAELASLAESKKAEMGKLQKSLIDSRDAYAKMREAFELFKQEMEKKLVAEKSERDQARRQATDARREKEKSDKAIVELREQTAHSDRVSRIKHDEVVAALDEDVARLNIRVEQLTATEISLRKEMELLHSRCSELDQENARSKQSVAASANVGSLLRQLSAETDDLKTQLRVTKVEVETTQALLREERLSHEMSEDHARELELRVAELEREGAQRETATAVDRAGLEAQIAALRTELEQAEVKRAVEQEVPQLAASEKIAEVGIITSGDPLANDPGATDPGATAAISLDGSIDRSSRNQSSQHRADAAASPPLPNPLSTEEGLDQHAVYHTPNETTDLHHVVEDLEKALEERNLHLQDLVTQQGIARDELDAERELNRKHQVTHSLLEQQVRDAQRGSAELRAQLEVQVTDSSKKLKALEAKLVEANGDVALSIQERRRAEDELQALRIAQSELAQRNARNEEELRRLNALVTDKSIHSAEIESELARLRDVYRTLDREKNQAKAEVEAVRSASNAARDEARLLLQQAGADVMATSQENDQLRRTVELHESEVARLTQELKESRDECRAVTTSLDDATSSLAKTEGELDSLIKVSQVKTKNLEREVERLQEQLLRAQSHTQIKSKQLEDLRKDKEEVEAEAEAELRELKQRYANILAELNDQREACATMDRSREEAERRAARATDQLSALQNEVGTLSSRLLAEQQAHERSQQLLKETHESINSQSASLQQLAADNERRSAAVAEVSAQCDRLALANEVMLREKVQASEKIVLLEHARKGVEAELATVQQKCVSLANEKAVLAAEHRQTVEELQLRSEELQQASHVRGELEAAKASLRSIEAVTTEQAASIASLQHALKDRRDDIAQQKRQLSEAQTSIANAVAERDHEKGLVRAAEERTREVEAERDAARREVDERREEVRAATLRYDEYLAANANHTAAMERVELEHEGTRIELRGAVAENARFAEEIAALQRLLADSTNQVVNSQVADQRRAALQVDLEKMRKEALGERDFQFRRLQETSARLQTAEMELEEVTMKKDQLARDVQRAQREVELMRQARLENDTLRRELQEATATVASLEALLAVARREQEQLRVCNEQNGPVARLELEEAIVALERQLALLETVVADKEQSIRILTDAHERDAVLLQNLLPPAAIQALSEGPESATNSLSALAMTSAHQHQDSMHEAKELLLQTQLDDATTRLRLLERSASTQLELRDASTIGGGAACRNYVEHLSTSMSRLFAVIGALQRDNLQKSEGMAALLSKLTALRSVVLCSSNVGSSVVGDREASSSTSDATVARLIDLVSTEEIAQLRSANAALHTQLERLTEEHFHNRQLAVLNVSGHTLPEELRQLLERRQREVAMAQSERDELRIAVAQKERLLSAVVERLSRQAAAASRQQGSEGTSDLGKPTTEHITLEDELLLMRQSNHSLAQNLKSALRSLQAAEKGTGVGSSDELVAASRRAHEAALHSELLLQEALAVNALHVQDITNLRIKVLHGKEEVVTLKDGIEKLEEQRHRQDGRLQAAAETLSSQQASIEALEEKCSSLQLTLDCNAMRKENLRTWLQSHVSANGISEHADNTKEDASYAGSELLEALKNAIEGKVSAESSANQLSEHLELEKSENQRVAQELAQSEDRVRALSAELQSAQAAMTCLRSAAEESKQIDAATAASLKTVEAAHRAAESRVALLEEQLAEHKQEVEIVTHSLTSRNDLLSSLQQRLAVLEEDKRTAHLELMAKDAELVRKENTITSLKRSLEGAKDNGSLREQFVTSLENELATLRAADADSRQESLRLRDQVSNLEVLVRNAEHTVDVEAAASASDRARLEGKIASLSADVDRLLNEQTESRADIAALQHKNSLLGDDNSSLVRRLALSQELNSHLKEQVNMMESARTAASTVKARIAENAADLATLQRLCDQVLRLPRSGNESTISEFVAILDTFGGSVLDVLRSLEHARVQLDHATHQLHHIQPVPGLGTSSPAGGTADDDALLSLTPEPSVAPSSLTPQPSLVPPLSGASFSSQPPSGGDNPSTPQPTLVAHATGLTKLAEKIVSQAKRASETAEYFKTTSAAQKKRLVGLAERNKKLSADLEDCLVKVGRFADYDKLVSEVRFLLPSREHAVRALTGLRDLLQDSLVGLGVLSSTIADAKPHWRQLYEQLSTDVRPVVDSLKLAQAKLVQGLDGSMTNEEKLAFKASSMGNNNGNNTDRGGSRGSRSGSQMITPREFSKAYEPDPEPNSQAPSARPSINRTATTAAQWFVDEASSELQYASLQHPYPQQQQQQQYDGRGAYQAQVARSSSSTLVRQTTAESTATTVEEHLEDEDAIIREALREARRREKQMRR